MKIIVKMPSKDMMGGHKGYFGIDGQAWEELSMIGPFDVVEKDVGGFCKIPHDKHSTLMWWIPPECYEVVSE